MFFQFIGPLMMETAKTALAGKAAEKTAGRFDGAKNALTRMWDNTKEKIADYAVDRTMNPKNGIQTADESVPHDTGSQTYAPDAQSQLNALISMAGK